ncbi:AlpA family phage regulatory protein [Aeromonas jandaei]
MKTLILAPSKVNQTRGTQAMVTQPSIKVLRMPAVEQKIGMSRSTFYDWLNPKSPRYDPTFPRPKHLGKHSVGWSESELDEWLLRR